MSCSAPETSIMLADLFMIAVWSAEGARRLSFYADETLIMRDGRRPGASGPGHRRAVVHVHGHVHGH